MILRVLRYCSVLDFHDAYRCCGHAQAGPTLWDPHRLQLARLLCPWDYHSKDTGVGCHFLLQGIFLTQGLNPCLLLWQVDSLPLSHLGSPVLFITVQQWNCLSLWTGSSLMGVTAFFPSSVSNITPGMVYQMPNEWMKALTLNGGVNKWEYIANILCWLSLETSLDKEESADRFNWRVILGSSAGKCENETGRKEEIEQVADVGNWGSVQLRKSGRQGRPCLGVMPANGWGSSGIYPPAPVSLIWELLPTGLLPWLSGLSMLEGSGCQQPEKTLR